MSDEIREAIRLHLDAVLREQIAADEVVRETRDVYNAAAAKATLAATEAQRLRMALYAVTGEDAGLGDANIANNRRRQELQREARDD